MNSFVLFFQSALHLSQPFAGITFEVERTSQSVECFQRNENNNWPEFMGD